ncbi:myb family transcription factor [Colletotrichum orchidophilum]|uniref:Myb family transcription factor n=1 Tax=Colletotrichum orchidophilum TaxID=1209926 RepID=A0A1G4BSZ7_9PEZI|nr:myb family transcription factor [Colletotrichum orchidophilum]OHF04552.1 myb family transcription factor [Colletotrichum orchidophilum]
MGLWSENEDERLIAAIQRWGTNWTKVAAEVGSRSADQCSSHWNHVLDPKINYCDWTPEEDADLLHEVLTNGTKWAQIASYHTPTRTTLALKNRYSTLRVKNENRSRTRQSHPNPSSGHATQQSIHAQANLRNSEVVSISNSSDNSESMRSDDAEGEEETEPVKENVKVIRTWLKDVSSDMDTQNDGGMNTRPSGPIGSPPVRMEGINVSMPDNTAWYEYAKESVLPTPDMNEGSGIAMEDYLQLDPALLRGQATEPPFNLPAGCFFDEQQQSLHKRNTSHLPDAMSTANQTLSDTAGCAQHTHAHSLDGSNQVTECNDAVVGSKTSVSKSTPFTSLAPHDETPPTLKSTKFRFVEKYD